MAVPDREDTSKIDEPEQQILNRSFDKKYDTIAVELVAENMAGTALVRLKAVESADSPGTYGLLVLNADGSAVSTGGGSSTPTTTMEFGGGGTLEFGGGGTMEFAA